MLTGELDSGTYPRLLAEFERAVAGSSGTGSEGAELHLDLAGLSFIDSAGLRAIIQIERAARERNLTLVVTPPPASLTELLSLAGVADRLTLVSHHDARPAYRQFLERIEVTFDPEPGAPARARAEIRRAALGLLGPRELEAAVLMTSELVTNAVIHPPSPEAGRVVLRITCYEDHIRCEISDPGPGFDLGSLARRVPETGGRGLMLVDILASRWGTERLSRGDERFCVWFELDAAVEDQAVSSG